MIHLPPIIVDHDLDYVHDPFGFNSFLRRKKEFCGCFRVSLLSQFVCLFVLVCLSFIFQVGQMPPKDLYVKARSERKLSHWFPTVPPWFSINLWQAACFTMCFLLGWSALHTSKSNETKGPWTKALKSVNKHWHLRLFPYPDDGPRTHRHPPPGSAPQMLRLKA